MEREGERTARLGSVKPVNVHFMKALVVLFEMTRVTRYLFREPQMTR